MFVGQLGLNSPSLDLPLYAVVLLVAAATYAAGYFFLVPKQADGPAPALSSSPWQTDIYLQGRYRLPFHRFSVPGFVLLYP